MTVTELLQKIESLPRQKQDEVAEFVDFLTSKYPARTRLTISARGKFANVGMSSDEFARLKDEEIDHEDYSNEHRA